MAANSTPEGHRKRLRERFMKSGLAGFHDYEIIELLLSLGTPRKDCKLQAKEAIKRFKTLRGALEAPPEELQQISDLLSLTFPHHFRSNIVGEFSEKTLGIDYISGSS